MTKETATWLDYSKPPPGYRVGQELLADRQQDPGFRTRAAAALLIHGSPAEALAAAWAHYKADNHPQGMPPCHADHRAAAWAWHDRRRAIIADVDAQTSSGGEHLSAWLRIALAWTEAECSEVETYSALPFPRSVDMPAALQRVLLPRPA